MASFTLWVMRVYIVWMKGTKVTLKNPSGKIFRDYLAGRTYPRDTHENDSLVWLFSFHLCAPHMALSRVSFSRNPLILHLSLILHQLNTKPNTIKSHKIQGNKLKQLQHILSWNKANIKHSCKSQLYTSRGDSFSSDDEIVSAGEQVAQILQSQFDWGDDDIAPSGGVPIVHHTRGWHLV